MIKFFCKLVLLLFTPFFAIAQQSKVDSVIHLINNVKGDVLDSLSFESVYAILQRAILTDNQITEIETAASRFKQKERKDWDYYIPGAISASLLISDPGNGRYTSNQIEKLEKINSPNVSYSKSRFLSLMRFQFLNQNDFEGGFKYFTQKLNNYKNANDSICISICYYTLGDFYDRSGLTDIAIYHLKKSISYTDRSQHKLRWESNMILMGRIYLKKTDKTESIKYSALAYNERLKRKRGYAHQAIHLAEAMLFKNQLDSAAYYIQKAKEDPGFIGQDIFLAAIAQTEALYNIQAGKLDQAENRLRQCWQTIKAGNLAVNQQPGTIDPDYYLALVRIRQNRVEEAIALLYKDIERLKNVRLDILRDYKLIAELYAKSSKYEKATKAYEVYNAQKDSLLTDQDKYRAFNFEAEQQMNEKELSITNLENQNKVFALFRNFSIATAILLLILVATIYFRYRSKKKANLVLENTLSQLKATQSQLIQSEKMASLGELTAGIAHEIQNPLNFVNNFSEVNTELIDELEQEVNKGNIEEAKLLAKDIKENEQKINHHGKRAADIVKGMLQHSRSSSGVKEPTDINKLADEYLRLAYHGLRAKDKGFNATMKTDFDESIGNIHIIPQDIGRVILNLITNGFYVVDEKKKSGIENYEPTVAISTKKLGDKIEIKVTDNGYGIPPKVLDKIFQPFFTTKPTGLGTGLGLSLSYDIVKAHGGELEVETKEGEGTTFLILLPNTNI